MLAVAVIVLLALPVVGGVVGYQLSQAVGAAVGACAGLLAAVGAIVLPLWLLVGARRRKAASPKAAPPDVPWA